MRERRCAGLPAIRTVILAIRTVILGIRTVIYILAIRTVISDGARACPQILAAHESRRAADGASDELTLLVAQSHCSIGLVFLKQATLGVHDGPYAARHQCERSMCRP